jgi:hypothetical protein
VNTKKISLVCLLAVALSVSAFGQASLIETSLSSAVTSTSQRVIYLASCTGINAASTLSAVATQLYIDTEMLAVESLSATSGACYATVQRGATGTRAQTHASGTTVYANPNGVQPAFTFYAYPQWGSCTATAVPVLPVIDYVDQYIENCVTSPITGVGQWNLVVQGTVNFPQPVTLLSAYTNAANTYTNVFTAGIPVHANLAYTVRCDIIWQGSAATAGPKYQWTGPAAPTHVAASATSEVTSSTFTQSVVTAFSTAMANAGTITATTNFHDTLTLGLVNGANGGTLVLQAQPNGSGTLTIQPGSFCVQQ